MPEPTLTRYLQPLIAGRRAECQQIIHAALAAGMAAETLLNDVLWPAMAQVDRLFRDDRINCAVESMAVRINRTIASQLQPRLCAKLPNGKRLLVMCSEGPGEESSAQVVADLFGAEGWEVYFMGGVIPDDEVLNQVGHLRPQVLLIFGTRPEGVPGTRSLIGLIREIGLCPTMNVVVSGGVFNRADGLWQEVGADIFASSAKGLVQLVNELRPREPGTIRGGLVKKRRRRRKAIAA